jgi:hypothetical protein
MRIITRKEKINSVTKNEAITITCTFLLIIWIKISYPVSKDAVF